jgi:hypothetical protein
MALSNTEIGNIFLDETHSLSGPSIAAARLNIALAIVNGYEREIPAGPSRPATTPTTVGAIPSPEHEAYQACQTAASAARKARQESGDVTGGAVHFNLRSIGGTAPFEGHQLRTQVGPLDNNFPTANLPAHGIRACSRRSRSGLSEFLRNRSHPTRQTVRICFAVVLTLLALLVPYSTATDEASNRPQPTPTSSAAGTDLRIYTEEVQPDGFLTVGTASGQPIEPTSITVGGVATTMQVPASGSGTLFTVKLSRNTPIGQQAVVIAAKDGWHFGSASITAVLDSVKATTGAANGVLTGGSILLQTLGTFPAGMSSLQVQFTRQPDVGSPTATPAASPNSVEITSMSVKDNEIIVSVPNSLPEGVYNIGLFSGSDGSKVNIKGNAVIDVHARWPIFWLALSPILVVGVIILLVCLAPAPKRSPSGKRYRWFDVLFLEDENNTYSLSRAQFIAWLAAISTAYVFLFITGGLVKNIWAFPPLTGFAYTFLVSLGTLVVAQATNSIKGSKGAGTLDPKPSDLVLNGDVLALDRVQQLVWTIISVGIFLWITFTTYISSNGLPNIPQELLTLMGISSGGYLVGKFVRRPGPIIQQISSEDNDTVKIFGESLSRDAFVWIDGSQIAKDKISVGEADPDSPSEFAKSLLVSLTLPSQPQAGAAIQAWRTKPHGIVVVNSDSQRAAWSVRIPQINSAKATSSAAGSLITVTGTGIFPDATLEARNPINNTFVAVSDFKPPAGTVDPVATNTWTGNVNFAPNRIRVTNPDKQCSEAAL